MFKALFVLYILHLSTIFLLCYIIFKKDELMKQFLDEFVVLMRKEIFLVKEKHIDEHSEEIVENTNKLITNNLPFL